MVIYVLFICTWLYMYFLYVHGYICTVYMYMVIYVLFICTWLYMYCLYVSFVSFIFENKRIVYMYMVKVVQLFFRFKFSLYLCILVRLRNTHVFADHAQILFWNQPLLSKTGLVSLSLYIYTHI